VQERGLTPDANLDGDMALQIVERQWFQLVKQPPPAALNIVKEFYANAIEHVNCVVMVRGKPVAFHANAINEYFGLETTIDDPYEDALPELDDLIDCLCKPGTKWVTQADTGEKLSFPQSALSRYGKAWHTFICARLMPTRHQHDVTKARAKLLYGIVHHHYNLDNSIAFYDVDVGACIQESIDRAIRAKTAVGLLHGFLITDLCRKAGVQWNPNEPSVQPTGVIDHATIARYKEWEGARSHPRGEGYIMIRQPSPPVDEEQVPPVAEEQQPPQTPRNQFNWLAARQDLMHQYNAQAFATLAEAFSRCNPSNPPVVMPLPPVLPPYPPSEEE